jgi:hypothetical protein
MLKRLIEKQIEEVPERNEDQEECETPNFKDQIQKKENL